MVDYNSVVLQDIFNEVVEGFNEYFHKVVFHVCIWLAVYIVLCAVVYVRFALGRRTRARGAILGKRALIVVAHPDDECMFFGPTILRLQDEGVDVHILCLSDGNYDNMGSIRRKELWSACGALGVPDANICLVLDTRLPDGPGERWPPPVIAKLIIHHIEAYDVDVLISFDRNGVSSHPNHSSIFYSIAYLFVEDMLPKSCWVYTLDSVSVLRKYTGFLDLPLSFLLSSKWYFLTRTEKQKLVKAMQQYKSQMVWFRHLYVVFSRYMLINTLRPLSLADVELELEVEE